jgi:hypothetical protein
MTKNYVLDEQPAQDQLDLLLDFYDIEIEDFEDFKSPDARVQEAMRSAVKRLLRYIRKGYIEITSDNGLTITQRLKFPKGETTELHYQIMTGKAKMQMKNADEDDFYGKIYCLIGSLTNIGATSISSLVGTDSSVAECLGAIFLTA